jgi:hypothetical protein
MDDVTDHGGMVNGFQWQKGNEKPAFFFSLVTLIRYKVVAFHFMQLSSVLSTKLRNLAFQLASLTASNENLVGEPRVGTGTSRIQSSIG